MYNIHEITIVGQFYIPNQHKSINMANYNIHCQQQCMVSDLGGVLRVLKGGGTSRSHTVFLVAKG